MHRFNRLYHVKIQVPIFRQSGAVLLMMLTLLVLVGSSLMLNQLGGVSPTAESERNRRTAVALAAAKAALLDYAAAYAENYPPFGPGFLPCPDTTNNGSPNPPCGRYAIGRLPWKYLGLAELRDGAGQRLWYALSANMRNNPKLKVLNSETAGQLSIDGKGRIVAVVIAPGSPLDHQQRALYPRRVESFLDGDNATPRDRRYTNRRPGQFNDRLLVISQQEWAAAVEARVLAEAQAVLGDYQARYGAYPWFSEFENPAISSFASSPGAYRGHLAVHRSGEEFRTGFTLDWRFQGARVRHAGSVRKRDLEKGSLRIDPDAGVCVWSRPERAECRVVQRSSGPCMGRNGVRIDRVFEIAFDSEFRVIAASKTDVRRRSLAMQMNTTGHSGQFSLAIKDFAIDGDMTGQTCGSGSLDGDDNTRGRVHMSGVRYELGVDNELPEWFVRNNWHHLLVAATAEGLAPGGDGRCDDDCLTLTREGYTSQSQQMVLISAGGPLPGQRRPAGHLTAYFEGANSDSDRVLQRGVTTARFNDQVRAVAR